MLVLYYSLYEIGKSNIAYSVFLHSFPKFLSNYGSYYGFSWQATVLNTDDQPVSALVLLTLGLVCIIIGSCLLC